MACPKQDMGCFIVCVSGVFMLDRNCVLVLSVLHLSVPFYVSVTQKII